MKSLSFKRPSQILSRSYCHQVKCSFLNPISKDRENNYFSQSMVCLFLEFRSGVNPISNSWIKMEGWAGRHKRICILLTRERVAESETDKLIVYLQEQKLAFILLLANIHPYMADIFINLGPIPIELSIRLKLPSTYSPAVHQSKFTLHILLCCTW